MVRLANCEIQYKLTLLGCICLSLFTFSANADEYTISIFDSHSNQTMVNGLHRIAPCAFALEAAVKKVAIDGAGSSVRVQRIASFSQDFGVNSHRIRGIQTHEVDVGQFFELSQVTLHRIMAHWRANGYSESELISLFNAHNALSLNRVKFITVENGDARHPYYHLDQDSVTLNSRQMAPPSDKFSAVRIYDSSKTPKSFGLKVQIKSQSAYDTIDLASRYFKGFELSQILEINGIQPSDYTWTLGLYTSEGEQDNALSTILSQVSDLLDLHYNNRDYMNFGTTESIENEDTDILLYGKEDLRGYYNRFFKELTDENGEAIFREKNGMRYYFYHSKGSQWIQKFFRLRFHRPLYGNGFGLRDELALFNTYSQFNSARIRQFREEHFVISNIQELFEKVTSLSIQLRIAMAANNSEQIMGYILPQFLLIRRNLPDDIFSPDHDEELKGAVRKFARDMGAPDPFSPGPSLKDSWPRALAAAAFIELLLRDPMLYIFHRTASAP